MCLELEGADVPDGVGAPTFSVRTDLHGVRTCFIDWRDGMGERAFRLWTDGPRAG